jgi:FkbM family methyltransferase
MIITSEGFAVLDDDSHISRWVEMEKRLDHDQNTLPTLLTLIHPGDTVVDVGAFIGDHTIAYLKAVGPDGHVYAFEPNPKAFECLEKNCPGALRHNIALGDRERKVEMAKDHNAGAAFTMPAGGEEWQACVTLDSYDLLRLNFLKVDVEGDECKVLLGGWSTIMRCRPIIFIEVADGHLRRQGFSRDWILGMLQGLGYSWIQLWSLNDMTLPQYDLICTPRSL